MTGRAGGVYKPRSPSGAGLQQLGGAWDRFLGEQPVKTAILDFRPAELLEDKPLFFTPQHCGLPQRPQGL